MFRSNIIAFSEQGISTKFLQTLTTPQRDAIECVRLRFWGFSTCELEEWCRSVEDAGLLDLRGLRHVKAVFGMNHVQDTAVRCKRIRELFGTSSARVVFIDAFKESTATVF